MAATPQAIREAIATNIRNAITEIQVTGYMLASPTPPCAYVISGEVDYGLTMGRGVDEQAYVVQALISLTTDRGAQARLDRMLEPTGADSMKTAIESDRTLGGIVPGLRVTKASGLQTYVIKGVEYVGCDWTVKLIS